MSCRPAMESRWLQRWSWPHWGNWDDGTSSTIPGSAHPDQLGRWGPRIPDHQSRLISVQVGLGAFSRLNAVWWTRATGPPWMTDPKGRDRTSHTEGG